MLHLVLQLKPTQVSIRGAGTALVSILHDLVASIDLDGLLLIIGLSVICLLILFIEILTSVLTGMSAGTFHTRWVFLCLKLCHY
jgi:uncharacterized membrane protein YfhO